MTQLSSSHGSHMENLENGKTFSSQGKVRKFWTDWKREFYPKHRKKEILVSFYLYFSYDFLIEVYLLNVFLYLLNSSNKTLKKILEIERKY